MKDNIFEKMAKNNNRSYFTPEDVSDALMFHDKSRVRVHVLDALAGNAGIGHEDMSLICFIAARGTPSPS